MDPKRSRVKSPLSLAEVGGGGGGGVIPLYKPSQGLQILLMSGVSVTSASQILESFWNIWSQVSDFPAHGPLTWKAEIHDGGH